MRRSLVIVITSALLVVACGDDDGDTTTTDATVTTDEVTVGDDETSGEDSAAAGADGDEPGAADAAAPNPDKPEVEVPASIPDELQVTTLIGGEGAEAEDGDILLVDYVGVRSVDGVEFDNSYDRGQPLSVSLGAGGVIAGWDQGLEGVRAGERRQLDIPSELAYGDEARSEIIRENEALTFVIDVRQVIEVGDPPTEAGVEPSEGATEVTSVDLIEGDGAVLEEGDMALVHFVLYRGDNLEALDSTWQTEPIPLRMDETGFPGLVEGMPGMRVGGRRAVVIPPEDGFGPEGNPQFGLPADTDIVVVVDLIGTY